MNLTRLAAAREPRNRVFSIGKTALALLLATLIGGCGGETADIPNNSFLSKAMIRNRSQPLGTGVSGRVISATTGEAIGGATLSASGVTATSAADGFYNLSISAGERHIVTVSAPGYSNMIKVVSVVANRSTPLSPQLIPIGTTQSISVASGGTVSVSGSQAQIVIPAACLVRTDGNPASTTVSVSVTPIGPGTDSNLMSGEYMEDVSGTYNPIESFGAALITAQDAAGVNYVLDTGCTATVRIPVSTRGTAVGLSPFYYLDASSGRWIQSGSGTLTGSAPNQYYIGTIDRLGYWSAEQAMTTVNVSGCIQDRNTGNPIANALIITDGADYSSISNTRSATDGTFTLPIMSGGSATIVGQSGSNLTNTVAIGPSTSDLSMTACLLGTEEGFGFNVRLTWGQLPNDIDSHLLTPTGEHVFYSSKGSLSAPPYAALDVDDVTGFGPEVVTAQRIYVGTYRYFLHNYSNTFSPGITGSPTRVELNFGNSLDVFTPPGGEGTNRYWHIFDVRIDESCVVELIPIDRWLSAEPLPIASTSPRLCGT